MPIKSDIVNFCAVTGFSTNEKQNNISKHLIIYGHLRKEKLLNPEFMLKVKKA